MLCTFQLPAKRKPLPYPCPICGKEYGTVQMVMFNPRFHPFKPYRIRKYSESPSGTLIRIGHYRPKPNGPSKRINKTWCSFRTIALKINPGRRRKKSISMGFTPYCYEHIKECGWCVKK